MTTGAANAQIRQEVCEFCGDPIIEHCKVKHREWIIVLPREIEHGDLLMRPRDQKIYQVTSVREREEVFTVSTGQAEKIVLHFPNLPVLVKRDRACGWPRCELHCMKCMSYAAEEECRAELLNEKPGLKRRRKAKDDPYSTDRIHVKSSARARSTPATHAHKSRKAPTQKKR
jgi:hypothetical protein